MRRGRNSALQLVRHPLLLRELGAGLVVGREVLVDEVQGVTGTHEVLLVEIGLDLQKKLEDLRAKAAMLSQDELAKRQQELMIKDQELQQLYADLQEDIATKEAQLTEKIYKNVAAIVKDIAKEESLQIVLVRSQANVLFANPKLDLTNRIIVAYDKKHP